MKNLLKIALTVLLGICVICAVSCNNNTNIDGNTPNTNENNVSITALETELKGSDDDFKFTINESSSGFSFKYVEDNATYSGEADENQNIISATFVYNNISNALITDKNKMVDALSRLLNKPGSLRLSELYAVDCVCDVASLQKALGAEYILFTAIDIVCENKTTEINGWSVSVKTSESTVTVTVNKKLHGQ